MSGGRGNGGGRGRIGGSGRGGGGGRGTNPANTNGQDTTMPDASAATATAPPAAPTTTTTATTRPEKYCPACNKYNHTWDRCNFNENSPNYKGNKKDKKEKKQDKPQAPAWEYDGYVRKDYYPRYTAEQNYCPTCNTTSHHEFKCPNQNAKSHLIVSKLVCTSCSYRGHTSAECRHPNAVHCVTCGGRSHKTAECQHAHRAKLTKWAENKDARFRWGEAGSRSILLGPGQQALWELENMQSTGHPYADFERKLALEQQAIDTAVISFKDQQEPMHFIPLAGFERLAGSLQTHVRPRDASESVRDWVNASRSTCSSARPSPQPFSTATTPSSIASLNSLSSTRASTGYSIISINGRYYPVDQISRALTLVQEDSLTALQRQIRTKYEASKKLYHQQNYNCVIQRCGRELVEVGLISEAALQGLQFAMAQGATFYRDPRVMEALAKYEKPVCRHCRGEGVVVNQNLCHMDYAGLARDQGAGILHVHDEATWGVIVAFGCRCCQDPELGYEWQSRGCLDLDVMSRPGVGV